MGKAELVIKGQRGILFDTIGEAMAAGREMRRAGAVVHIEVFPESVPGPMTGFRYDDELDRWIEMELPI